MSAPAHDAPPDDASKPEPFLPRWAVYVMVPGLLGPLLILGFILFTEYAHDERRCPYSPLSERTLAADVRVREDARRCMTRAEERRYTLLRGPSERVLGRRRFAPDAFARGHYRWQASLGQDGQVHVSVHNDGHADAEFREGTAAEHAQAQ
ncbi:MAG TPA: hypothetical protein VF331_06090 [Polyangiales bacterium]